MTEELKKATECPVCFYRLIPPVDTCQNGHAICQDCRGKIEVCPTCSSNFTNNRNTLLNQMIELVPVPCKYKASGCMTETPIKKIKLHENICCYKEEKCFSCNGKYIYHTLNDHFKIHFSNGTETNCFKSYNITFTFKPKTNPGSYKIIYLKDVKTYFLHRFFSDWQNKILTLSTQYMGKKEEAHKYLYELTINQNPGSSTKDIFTCTGICIPYCYLHADWKCHKRAITLKMDQIFLTDECPEKFMMTFSIKKATNSIV